MLAFVNFVLFVNVVVLFGGAILGGWGFHMKAPHGSKRLPNSVPQNAAKKKNKKNVSVEINKNGSAPSHNNSAIIHQNLGQKIETK